MPIAGAPYWQSTHTKKRNGPINVIYHTYVSNWSTVLTQIYWEMLIGQLFAVEQRPFFGNVMQSTFWRIEVASSSSDKQLEDRLTPQDAGTWTSGNDWSNDTALHPRRLKSSATPLCKPKISHHINTSHGFQTRTKMRKPERLKILLFHLLHYHLKNQRR